MIMIYSVSRIIIPLCLLIIGTIALELYIDPMNEAEGPKRRTRGFYLPHEDYKQDKEGTPYLNMSSHVQLTSSSNQTCQQNLLDTSRSLLCVHHKLIIDIGRTLLCMDNAIYIQHYDCFTYDNDLCSVSLGTCPYAMGAG